MSGAKNGIFRIDRDTVDDAQTEAVFFFEGAGSQVDKADDRRQDKRRRLVMSQDGLIPRRVEVMTGGASTVKSGSVISIAGPEVCR